MTKAQMVDCQRSEAHSDHVWLSADGEAFLCHGYPTDTPDYQHLYEASERVRILHVRALDALRSERDALLAKLRDVADAVYEGGQDDESRATKARMLLHVAPLRTGPHTGSELDDVIEEAARQRDIDRAYKDGYDLGKLHAGQNTPENGSHLTWSAP